MEIYNSKTGTKQQFTPLEANKIKMYVCGPTLYSQIHIGNARPLIFFDVVARFFASEGYQVEYVSNITDIDDKIINRALELGVSEEQLVAENIKLYNEIREKLNLQQPLAMPLVTDYIDDIISYIQHLLDIDAAYQIGNNVYFNVEKVATYGEISNQSLAQMQSQGRIENDTNKRKPGDFVLWKDTEKGIKWDAGFGVGRPGWHTECVVMINKLLGQTIDIHGGGVDLKFPHHENENAQSHSCGHDLANVWMHNGFLTIEDEKMSKSIGNVIYPQELVDRHGSNYLRLMMLNSNYRAPINVSEEYNQQLIKQSNRLQQYYREYGVNREYQQDEIIELIQVQMRNDFNTVNSLDLFFNNMRSDISSQQKTNLQTYVYQVFGFCNEQTDVIPEEIKQLVEARQLAKASKDFKLADEIRAQISAHGYEIKDTREGVKCHKK